MRSIESAVTNTIVIQKSKFICKLQPIQTVEEVKMILGEAKQEYPGATHYCYAYIIDTQKHCSDDGEPNGTAGMPILNMLEKNNLHYILCIIIRYFGGIKLGANGLVRAYSNVTKNTLEMAHQIELIKGKIVSLTFPYSHEKQMNYLLSKYRIVKKEYQEQIQYIVELPESDFGLISTSIEPYASIHSIKDLLIKK